MLADRAHKKGISTQSRQDAKTPRRKRLFAPLQCYFRELRIFGKIFPPLFSLCAPFQVLWLRLAALGPCAFALRTAVPSVFLPERNAKNTETRTYVVFSLHRNPSESLRFAKIFTTDGRRWTQMEWRFISVCIGVNPWFNSFGCGWPRWDHCDLLRQFIFGCGWPLFFARILTTDGPDGADLF